MTSRTSCLELVWKVGTEELLTVEMFEKVRKSSSVLPLLLVSELPHRTLWAKKTLLANNECSGLDIWPCFIMIT